MSFSTAVKLRNPKNQSIKEAEQSNLRMRMTKKSASPQSPQSPPRSPPPLAKDYYGEESNQATNLRGYVLGMNFKLHQQLCWKQTIAYFLKFFPARTDGKQFHLVLDARFATKDLFDYLATISLRSSIAFKSNVLKYMWTTLGFGLKVQFIHYPFILTHLGGAMADGGTREWHDRELLRDRQREPALLVPSDERLQD